MTGEDDLSPALHAILERRHSVRAFHPHPVPEATIRRVVDIARRAPSWCNTQPWHLEITTGAATERFREALQAAAVDGIASGGGADTDFPFPARYVGAYQERRRETALRLYDAVGIARGDRVASARQTAENFSLFGAPHVAILTTDADLGVYGAVDCGLFLGAFLLALEAAGVGAIAQAALATRSSLVRDHFGLPADRRVLCGVSFGYEDRGHPANTFRTSRMQIDDLVTWHG